MNQEGWDIPHPFSLPKHPENESTWRFDGSETLLMAIAARWGVFHCVLLRLPMLMSCVAYPQGRTKKASTYTKGRLSDTNWPYLGQSHIESNNQLIITIEEIFHCHSWAIKVSKIHKKVKKVAYTSNQLSFVSTSIKVQQKARKKTENQDAHILLPRQSPRET